MSMSLKNVVKFALKKGLDDMSQKHSGGSLEHFVGIFLAGYSCALLNTNQPLPEEMQDGNEKLFLKLMDEARNELIEEVEKVSKQKEEWL